MASPRWTKLLRDATAERGRLALMGAAIAVSLTGVGAVLGAYAILTREIRASYLGTRPAHATLELPQGATRTLAEAVRSRPGVADAEPREVLVARARVGGEWRRLLLFAIDDFSDVRLARFRPEAGAWPPPDGTMLVERSALGMLDTSVGGLVQVKTAHGAPRMLPVAGVVHDPSLAPAWQERSGYGYVSRATLALLGEPPLLGELRIAFAGDVRGVEAVEARAAEVARWLAEQGHPVRQIQVPPPGQHPHQRQMVTVLVMMLVFAGMALLLSAVLVASSLAALLGRQIREIAILKTLGARPWQVARLYAAFVGLAGAAAVALSVPLAVPASRALAGAVARLLNFDLATRAIPAWVLAVQVAAGVAVPLLVASLPIGLASRRTIRASLDDHGSSGEAVPGALAALPLPLRNVLRRPGRLALSLGLLASAGAMALTAIQVERGWEANIAKVYATRSYDVEVTLEEPASLGLVDALGRVPGVRGAELWGYAPAAFSRPGAIDVVRTYPDRGHGALVAMGIPPRTGLVRFPVRAGRWLRPDDRGTDALVLNHVAAQASGRRLGDDVTLSLGGRLSRWRVVGIVEEIGSPGTAYASDVSFGLAAGTEGEGRLLRVTTSSATPAARAALVGELEGVLAGSGARVQSILPLAELRTAMGDHILVLVRMLEALAAILALVGFLGLVSATSVSVVERTRELAVLKTLGGTPGRLTRMLLAEALTTAALAYALGCVLSVPLTALVDGVVGRLGFLAPLPLVLSPAAAAAWLALSALGTVVATAVPARRAGALSIREALART